MGSDFWVVTVISKGNKWIDLEVKRSSPDAGDFPEDRAFALLLLTSEGYGFGPGFQRIPKGPLGEAIEFNKSYLPDAVSPRVPEFIEKVVVYEAHNLPYNDDEAVAKTDDKVLADGIERGSADWGDAWGKYWNEFWASKADSPWAKYRIWVTDDKWTSHLQLEQSFDTPAYSDDGPFITEERLIDPERGH
mmetsp:Transcript_12476/g.13450  ORF Transcript_12476/g.13450 Transcript_12476/m.13450 type:complete len:190 (+) Transcript_12476:29-598(+)